MSIVDVNIEFLKKILRNLKGIEITRLYESNFKKEGSFIYFR